RMVHTKAEAIYRSLARAPAQERGGAPRAAAGDLGAAAGSDAAAAGLFVLAALPICGWPVPHPKAVAGRGGIQRAPVCLLPSDRDRSRRQRMMQQASPLQNDP